MNTNQELTNQEEQELIEQLKRILGNEMHRRSMLINPATQEFMSIDDSKRITCPLIVEEGQMKPNLVLSRNETVLKICSEFQENAIYFDEFQNKQDSSFEYKFSDTADKIICRITNFDEVINCNTNTYRIIQFDQNSQEAETNPSQWKLLKNQDTKIFNTGVKLYSDDYNELIAEELKNSFGFISNELIANHCKIMQLRKSYWFNFEPEGFIVCITDLVKKVLIVTLKNDGTFGNIPITKRVPLRMIRLVWPELAIRKRQTNGSEDVLISETLKQYFPDVSAGVLRITKFHNDMEIKCKQTHKSCC